MAGERPEQVESGVPLEVPVSQTGVTRRHLTDFRQLNLGDPIHEAWCLDCDWSSGLLPSMDAARREMNRHAIETQQTRG